MLKWAFSFFSHPLAPWSKSGRNLCVSLEFLVGRWFSNTEKGYNLLVQNEYTQLYLVCFQHWKMSMTDFQELLKMTKGKYQPTQGKECGFYLHVSLNRSKTDNTEECNLFILGCQITCAACFSLNPFDLGFTLYTTITRSLMFRLLFGSANVTLNKRLERKDLLSGQGFILLDPSLEGQSSWIFLLNTSFLKHFSLPVFIGRSIFSSSDLRELPVSCLARELLVMRNR